MRQKNATNIAKCLLLIIDTMPVEDLPVGFSHIPFAMLPLPKIEAVPEVGADSLF
jgi:hypothetical protein